MAAPAGYNEQSSLLPSAGGTIHRMSGGGSGTAPPHYTYTNSMLPASGGDISLYKGGAFPEKPDISLSGGLPQTRSQTAALLGAAATVTSDISENCKNFIKYQLSDTEKLNLRITFEKFNELINNAKSLRMSEDSIKDCLHKSNIKILEAATESAAGAAGRGAAKPLESKRSNPLTSGAAGAAAVQTGQKSSQNNNSSNQGTKTITLFGTSIQLESPSTGARTVEQNKALALFGLDGPAVSDKEKTDILTALYKGKCDTDKPLSMATDCEPVRKIVQSLALNMLGQLKVQGLTDTNKNQMKSVQPQVQYKVDGDNVTISLTFTKQQLPQLSAFKAKPAAAPAPTAAAAAPVTPSQIATNPLPTDGGSYEYITTKGIENNNIYCYAISTIQMLYSIPDIRRAVLNFDCSTHTIDDTTINTLVNPKSGQQDTIKEKAAQMKDSRAPFSDGVDTDLAFCVLKHIFTLLSQNTTTFDKLQGTTKSLTTTPPVPVYYVKYFTKVWGEYSNKRNQLKVENPDFNFDQQQDATEFLQEFIIPLFESNNTLKDLLNIFNSRVDTRFQCEIKKDSEGKPLTWTRIEPENNKVITLKPYEYIAAKQKTTKLQENWKTTKDSKSYIELDKLIEFNQNPEPSIELKKCGEGGNNGSVVKKPKYSITETNKYLLFVISRTEQTQTSEQIKQAKGVTGQIDPNLNILANPTITVDGKQYHLYGSILYNPLGQTVVKKQLITRTSGGHYLYDRFYIKDDSTPDSKALPSSFPFVLYNDGNVTYNDNSYSIDNKSYIIIYRLVPGQTTPFSPEIPEIPNEKCKIVQQWLDTLENKNTEITEALKQELVNQHQGLTIQEIDSCINYFRSMEGAAAAAPAEQTQQQMGQQQEQGLETGAPAPAAAQAAIAKPTLEVFDKTQNSFKVKWQKNEGVTYDISATKDENTNKINPKALDNETSPTGQVKQVVEFVGLEPGTYTITLQYNQTGLREDISTTKIKIPPATEQQGEGYHPNNWGGGKQKSKKQSKKHTKKPHKTMKKLKKVPKSKSMKRKA